MDNPLLNLRGLPPFNAIRPEHIEPAVETLLANNRAGFAALLAGDHAFSWTNLIEPMQELDEGLERMWSVVTHLNGVLNSDALRVAYNACLPKLSDYSSEMGQNVALFQAFQQIREGDHYAGLDTAQRKIIDNALREFHLSGIALNAADQRRYKAIQQELSSLAAKFEDNVLDATTGWRKHIDNEADLAGLPPTSVAMARQSAEQEGLSGWLFTLEYPSYMPVLKYADNRALRRELYEAYVTRASELGPNAGQWDNTANIERLLQLRHDLAQLLGFANFAELSLAKKMAKKPHQVTDFLLDLARRSRPMAQAELAELAEFAASHHAAALSKLESWDIAYYTEKLCQEKYSISQEDLRPYFPETRVVEGMFAVVERLYNLRITEKKNVETWHPDVRFFEICDTDNQPRGQFYLDLYARQQKRGGAWMAECITRKRSDSGVQIPVAYLTCNFTAPVGNDPALFTHDEVLTLFHEFGHGLHHMLTRVDYPAVAGINGVAWDAVELPSQFMENWCWEREALDLLAAHYQTGARLPDELFDKMIAAKNFQSGMHMVRQLEFSLFDFRLHLEFDPALGACVTELLHELRETVSVIQPPAFNRFPNSFTHIFSGGYAAGYYSYKWAEVLSSDAFGQFEANGIFDQVTGQRFLNSILERGGVREPMDMVVEFLGREPNIDALLRHSGIAA